MPKLKHVMDLQFFAEPNEPGDDDNIDELDEDEIDLADLLEEEALDEAEIDEDEQNEDGEQNPPSEVTFTPEQQAKMNQVIQERLARDRAELKAELDAYRQKEATLQRKTNLSFEKVIETIDENKVRALMEEDGLSEEDAKKRVADQEELQLRREEDTLRNKQMTDQQRENKYFQEKQKHLNNPFVKKYEAKIDEFALNGVALEFVPAMNFILGQMVVDGELTNQIRAGAEQKTLRAVEKRGKAAPVNGSTGGQANTKLSNQEKLWAHRLGVDPKEYAAEKAKLAKKR